MTMTLGYQMVGNVSDLFYTSIENQFGAVFVKSFLGKRELKDSPPLEYEKIKSDVLRKLYKGKFPFRIDGSTNFSWVPEQSLPNLINGFWFIMKINILLKFFRRFHDANKFSLRHFVEQLLMTNYAGMSLVEKGDVVTISPTTPQFTSFKWFNEFDSIRYTAAIQFGQFKYGCGAFFENVINFRSHKFKDVSFITKITGISKLQLANLIKTSTENKLSISCIKFVKRSFIKLCKSKTDRRWKYFGRLCWIMKFFLFLFGNGFPSDKEILSNSAFLEFYPSFKTFEDEIFKKNVKRLVQITLNQTPLFYKVDRIIGLTDKNDKLIINFLRVGVPVRSREHKTFSNFNKNYNENLIFREFTDQLILCSLGGFYTPNSSLNRSLYCNETNGLKNLMKLYYRLFFNDDIKKKYLNKYFLVDWKKGGKIETKRKGVNQRKYENKNYLKAFVGEFLFYHLNNGTFVVKSRKQFFESQVNVTKNIEKIRKEFFCALNNDNKSLKKDSKKKKINHQFGRWSQCVKINYEKNTLSNCLKKIKLDLQSELIINELFEVPLNNEKLIKQFNIPIDHLEKLQVLINDAHTQSIENSLDKFPSLFDIDPNDVKVIKSIFSEENDPIKNAEIEIKICGVSNKTKIYVFIFLSKKNTQRIFIKRKMSIVEQLVNKTLDSNSPFSKIIIANCCKSSPRLTNSLNPNQIGYIHIGIGYKKYYCTKKEHCAPQKDLLRGLKIIDGCRDVINKYIQDIFCNHDYRPYSYKYYRFKLTGVDMNAPLPDWFQGDVLKDSDTVHYSANRNDNPPQGEFVFKEKFNAFPTFSSRFEIKKAFIKTIHSGVKSFYNHCLKDLFKNIIPVNQECDVFSSTENTFWYESPVKEKITSISVNPTVFKKDNKKFDYLNVAKLLRVCHCCKLIKEFNLLNYKIFYYMCEDCEVKYKYDDKSQNQKNCLLLDTSQIIPFFIVKCKGKFKNESRSLLKMFY